MAKDIELTLMLADYHRTRPLLNGEVSARGSTPKSRDISPIVRLSVNCLPRLGISETPRFSVPSLGVV